MGRAVAVGILSHLVLDLATHGHDIVLSPGWPEPKLGLGLYAAAPFAAFVVELVYGVFCWWVYRGRRGLLVLIVAGNLANLSLLSPSIAGPEQDLANHPTLIVTVILAQIVVTLSLVGVLSKGGPGMPSGMERSRRQPFRNAASPFEHGAQPRELG